jgi:hypothetical protein
MFVYLSGSGGRVELPTAVDVLGEPDDELVRFVDVDGNIIAVFRRADTAIFSETDMGPSLSEE